MNGKTKSPVLPFILGILLLYTTYTRWPETEHMLDVLFGSTPSYLQRYFSMRPMDFLVLIFPLLGVICLAVAAKRLRVSRGESASPVAAAKRGKRSTVHTHDRTDTVSYDKKETQADHYIKQLNGFLKAGIFEKNEYDLLIRRYKP